jgi:hypothetical protein
MAELTNCPDCKVEQEPDRVLITFCEPCRQRLIENANRKKEQ